MRVEPETFLDRSHALEGGGAVHFSHSETRSLLADMRSGGLPIARIEAMELLGHGDDRWLSTIFFHPPGIIPTEPPTAGTFLYQWNEGDYDAQKVVSYFTSMLDSIDTPRSADLTYAVWAEPR